MQEKKNKKILIVSPYFAPENSVASIRFSKIAKYLIKAGYQVDIMCTQMTNYFIIDETLKKDMDYYKKIYRINYPKILYYNLKKKFGIEKDPQNSKKEKVKIQKIKTDSKKSRLINMLVQAYLFICDLLLAQKYINFVKHNDLSYDVVITTFNPFAPHILGKYMKKNGRCNIWIADFRDTLMSLQEQNVVTKFLEAVGASFVRKADYITTVSKGGMKKLENELQEHKVNVEGKLVQLSNGYDPMDRKELIKFNSEKGKLSFIYCGTIYKFDGKIQTDVSPLFHALAELIQEKAIERDKIELHYAGSCQELFVNLAAQFGLDDLVVYEGIVSRNKSLELQRKSDIILVAIWNNKENSGILTGKFFETILVKRNVLCLVKGNQSGSELGEIIKSNHYGFAYEEINNNQSQLKDLKKWLLDQYNKKLEKDELCYMANEEQINLFSHENIAQKLSLLFDK